MVFPISDPDRRIPCHSVPYTVGLAATDPAGELRMDALLSAMQDVSAAHSDRIGLPVTRLVEAGLTWVIQSIRATASRLPKWGEHLLLDTWRTAMDPEEPHHAPRGFLLVDAKGNSIVEAETRYVLLDLATGKPVSPWEILPDYPLLEKTPPKENRRIVAPASPHWSCEVPLRRSDIDFNHHLNNTLHPRLALEALPEEFVAPRFWSEFSILYRRPVGYPETLKAVAAQAGNTTSHALIRMSDNVETTRMAVGWKMREAAG